MDETIEDERAQLRERIRKCIQSSHAWRCRRRTALSAHQDADDGSAVGAERDQLFLDLCRYQYRYVEGFRRFLDDLGVNPADAVHPLQIPALPTAVFRYTRLATHDASLDLRRFYSSGTTGQQRHRGGVDSTSRLLSDDDPATPLAAANLEGQSLDIPRSMHAFRSLGLYDLSARTEAAHALFNDDRPRTLIFLAPLEAAAPESSLSYMFSRFRDWFGQSDPSYGGGFVEAWGRDAAGGDTLRSEVLVEALNASVRQNRPVALLGTTFAFVHAEQALGESRFRLPEHSFLLHTGGYKGRSTEYEPAELRALLRNRYGLRDEAIRSEYSMTELSSQMYEWVDEHSARGEAPAFEVPPWVRAVPVSPESGAPVAPGEIGLLRIEDIVNLDSVCVIQTADRARWTGRGLELLGRDADATPRGCSIGADIALTDPSYGSRELPFTSASIDRNEDTITKHGGTRQGRARNNRARNARARNDRIGKDGTKEDTALHGETSAEHDLFDDEELPTTVHVPASKSSVLK